MDKITLVQRLEQSTPAGVATLPEVADRFKYIYSIMNGGNSQMANLKYEAEKFHFMKILQDKPVLKDCSKLSLYGCFMDMAVNGLSFDPAMKHAYLTSFNTNVGTKDNPKWEKRATVMISGPGELVMRMRQGQIKYADNPVLVYEGDAFKYGTKDRTIYVEHEAVIPRVSPNIIACYIRIERTDNSVDYKVLSMEEVMQLKAFSKDPKSLAWTSGLPGMIQAKTIKHAFKSYPKVRMGDFSNLQTQIIEPEAGAPKIDYGLNGSMPPPAAELQNHFEEVHAEEVATKPIEQNQTAASQPVDDNSFTSNQKAPAKTVTFEDDEF